MTCERTIHQTIREVLKVIIPSTLPLMKTKMPQKWNNSV